MKYPKTWDGPNPVGEAKVRAMQNIDAPFLSVRGPGYTARKRGGFLEVRGGDKRVLVAWPGQLANAPQTALVATNGWRVFRERTLLSDTARSVGSSSAETRLGGHLYVLKRGVSTNTVDLYDFTGRAPARDVLTFASSFQAALVYNTVPARFVNDAWGFGLFLTFGGAARYARLLEVAGEPTLSETDVHVSTSAYVFVGGVGMRFRPDMLLFFALEHRSPTAPDVEPVGFRLVARQGTADGTAWAAFTEPALQALAYPLDPASRPFATNLVPTLNAACVLFAQSLAALPVSTGEILYACRAFYMRGSTGSGVGFDAANASAYGTGAGVATAGVTILKGPLGSAQVTYRFSLPDRSLQVVSAAVSGRRVVMLVVDVGLNRYINAVPYPNPHFDTLPGVLLESEDDGDTWTSVTLPVVGSALGGLSVLSDGRFALPVRETGDEYFTIYAFRQFAQRSRIGRLSSEPDHGEMGEVVEINDRNGRAVHPMPGTPWVCDERVNPPWEV